MNRTRLDINGLIAMANEPNKKLNLFPEERTKAILDLIRRTGRSTVIELAAAFNTTAATIRRDLARLESMGFIRRTHGGALAMEVINTEYSISQRVSEHYTEKERIAQRVPQLLGDARVIFLDAGTTTLLVSQHLQDRQGLTVITCSPDIAIELAKQGQVETILTGGILRRYTMALGGPLAILTLEQLRADVAVLGMTAISAKDGMFTINPVDAEVKKKMMRNSGRTIVVADGSKLGRLATSFVAKCNSMDYLITDASALKDEVDAIRSMEIKVIVAD